MVSFVYGLCALTALLCALLLFRAYARSRSRVLWWSGLCFSGLMLSNVVLVVDKLVLPEIDLLPWRLAITLVSIGMLLVGLLYAHD
jgi:hypothetical protein